MVFFRQPRRVNDASKRNDGSLRHRFLRPLAFSGREAVDARRPDPRAEGLDEDRVDTLRQQLPRPCLEVILNTPDLNLEDFRFMDFNQGIVDGGIAVVVGFADDAAVGSEPAAGKGTDPGETGMGAKETRRFAFVEPTGELSRVETGFIQEFIRPVGASVAEE